MPCQLWLRRHQKLAHSEVLRFLFRIVVRWNNVLGIIHNSCGISLLRKRWTYRLEKMLIMCMAFLSNECNNFKVLCSHVHK